MRKTLVVVLGMAGAVAIAGCVDELVVPQAGAAFSARAPRFSISITLDPDTLAAGDSTRALAVVRDRRGGVVTGRTITWRSGDTTIASVSAIGMVQARRAGQTTIQASTADASDRVTLTVLGAVTDSVPTDSVPTDSTGGPALPPYTLTPAGGQLSFLNGDVVITAPAGALADTTTFMVLTAPATALTLVGSAITVTTEPAVASFNSPVRIDIAYAPSLLPVGVNESELGVYRLGAGWTIAPGSAVNTSTNRVAASISSAGTVGVLGAPVATVVVSPPSASTSVGSTVSLSAVLRDAAGGLLPNRAVTWTSSAPAVATVSGSGVVAGATVGTATIRATSEGKSGSATVTVTASAPAGTVAFADGFETGTFGTIANGFGWKTPDGTDAVAGTGRNGSFTRTSGTWPANMVGVPVYLQSVAGNQSGDAGVMGPFIVTSQTSTTLYFTGDATGAVQKRTHRAFVTSTFARSGTRSVKFIFGPDAQEADSRSQLGFNLPLPGVGEMWLEYYLFIPANYAHRTQSGGITNNKFGGIFFRERASDPSRMLFDFETIADGSNGSSMFAQSVYSTGSISSQAVRVHGDAGFTGTSMIGSAGSPAVLGAWNQFRLHFKSETAAGAADGLQEMWINGTKVFRASGRSFGYPSASGSSWFGTYPALVDSGYLLGAANSGYSALTIFYVDDVKFYLLNPGW
jgi:uncharacterized protein YjdB